MAKVRGIRRQDFSMNDKWNSPTLSTRQAALKKRLANADKFFAEHPDRKTGVRKKVYDELELRYQFVLDAISLMDAMTSSKGPDNKSMNSETAMSMCYSLYCLALTPYMYEENTPEWCEYCEALVDMRKLNPSWEKQLYFAGNNIVSGLSRYNTLTQYYKTLVRYVEICVDFFLWLRQTYNPIPEPNKENENNPLPA